MLLTVFVRVMVSVFFRVIVPRAYDAYYRLSDPAIQIRSFVLDVIRSTVPKLSLDEAFTSTSDITDAVFCRLHQVMKEFGYEIVQTLITELRPNMRVKASMNAVKAARSLKEAMSHQAEVGEYFVIVEGMQLRRTKILTVKSFSRWTLRKSQDHKKCRGSCGGALSFGSGYCKCTRGHGKELVELCTRVAEG
jgi:hypothetical protein